VIFYVSAETDSIENLYGNNNASVEVEPTRVTNISMNDPALDLASAAVRL